MGSQELPDTPINRAMTPEYFRVDPNSRSEPSPLLAAPPKQPPPIVSGDGGSSPQVTGPRFADEPDNDWSGPGMDRILSDPAHRPVLPSKADPVLAQPANSFAVDVDKLVPAASKAASIGLDLKVLSGEVGQPPPPGTPGFKIGFQMGELGREWSTAIMRLANGSQAAADKIYRTRTQYRDNETELQSMFGAGA
ncbi:hypothetical protein [Embleya sp. NPDC050493]|uniref:hypothetical protein n=1 Tax=Embleya sp. NPDC050493 TaxID=3363989 RepID=UPI0037B4B04D